MAVAVYDIKIKVDLNAPQTVVGIADVLQYGDNQANRFIADVYKGGVPYQLSGSCTGYFILPNGDSFPITGVVEGNQAAITLPQAAYAIPGQAHLILRNVLESTVTTLLAVRFTIAKNVGDAIIDPTGEIPSLDQLLAAISRCNTAANSAEAAAGQVDSAISTMESTLDERLDAQDETIAGYNTRITAAETAVTGLTSEMEATTDQVEQIDEKAMQYRGDVVITDAKPALADFDAAGYYRVYNQNLYRTVTIPDQDGDGYDEIEQVPAEDLPEDYTATHGWLYVMPTRHSDGSTVVRRVYQFLGDTDGTIWWHVNDAPFAHLVDDELRDALGVLGKLASAEIIAGAQPENGNVSSAGLWNNITEAYQHVLWPIAPGDSITIVNLSTNGTLNYAVMATPTTPTDGQAAGLSAVEGFTGLLQLAVGTAAHSFKAPADATHILIMARYGGVERDYSLTVNGIDVTATLDAHARLGALEDIIDYATIESVSPARGNLTKTGLWNNVSAAYQHILWPIKPGDIIAIRNTTTDGTLNYGIMANPTTPTNGQSAGCSAAAGYSGVLQLTAGSATNTFEAPADATHILIMTLYNTAARTFELKINGIDVTAKLGEALSAIGKRVEQLDLQTILTYDAMISGVPVAIAWESGRFDYTSGAADLERSEATRLRTAELYEAHGAIRVITDSEFNTLVSIFERNTTDGIYYCVSTRSYSQDEKWIPAGSHYRICLQYHADTTRVLTDYDRNEIPKHVQVLDVTGASIYDPGVRWCALGDSITQGYVSYYSESKGRYTAEVRPTECWVSKLAMAKNWHISNKGVGGSGYVMRTATDIGDSTYNTPAWKVVQGIDFTPYNLVTLAYGVNDYKGNPDAGYMPDGVPIGSMNDAIGDRPEKLIPAMRKTIETILASNPKLKLVIITPLNCHGYSGEFGNQLSNYAYGHERSSDRTTGCGTLKDVRDAMIEVCEYYGLEYIDMTAQSCVNRLNLEDLLLDGVHPGADCHTLLAHELGAKIHF